MSVWLLLALIASMVTAQFLPLLRQGRIFNFRAWSGRPGPYLKRHPIPIRLYSLPPQHHLYYFPAHHHNAAPTVPVRQSEPQHSSYETVPYVYPPNDFDAVKGLNLSGDPFLKNDIPTHSSINTLPLEPFQQTRYENDVLIDSIPQPQDSHSVKVDDINAPSSIFVPGFGVQPSHTFSEQSTVNVPVEAVRANSAPASFDMYASPPAGGAKIDPIVAAEVDALLAPVINPSVEAEIDPMIKAEIASMVTAEVESVLEDAIDDAIVQVNPDVDDGIDSELVTEIIPVDVVIRDSEDDTILETNISPESAIEVASESNVTLKNAPRDAGVTSGSDGSWNTFVLSPRVTGYMTSSVALLSDGLAEGKKQQAVPVRELNSDVITESNASSSNSTADSLLLTSLRSTNVNKGAPEKISQNTEPISVKQESSVVNDLADEITVIRKIYPTNQPTIGVTITGADANKSNKDLFVIRKDESMDLGEEPITTSVPSSLEEERDTASETQDKSLFIEYERATINSTSNHSSNNTMSNETLLKPVGKPVEEIIPLPEPPRPLVPPISTRATPTFLIRRLKEKFPHRAALQETFVSDRSKAQVTRKEESILPVVKKTAEHTKNAGVPERPVVLVRPDDDKKGGSRGISSAGIGSLPLESHDTPNESAGIGAAPLPGTTSESGEGVRGYRFSYSVEDDHSGSSYSRYEKSDGVLTQGQYSVLLPDGRTQVVKFFDDGLGYHADVHYV